MSVETPLKKLVLISSGEDSIAVSLFTNRETAMLSIQGWLPSVPFLIVPQESDSQTWNLDWQGGWHIHKSEFIDYKGKKPIRVRGMYEECNVCIVQCMYVQ